MLDAHGLVKTRQYTKATPTRLQRSMAQAILIGG